MGYFFRCNAALEISVSDFIAARYVRKRNGEVPFAVVRKPCLPAFSFRQCLEEVVFSAELQEIDDEAFRGVAELMSVTLSNNIQRIGYQAFSDCEQLSKVAYVGEMKTADCMVEIGAFQNCTSLTSFAFPQSLSEVQFQNCTSLTSFAFPQSLSEVQGWTFVGCRKLKEIILPKSVKKVGDQALRTNSTVETITFEGEEAPELTGNPFPFKENILKIMVPSGKSEAYKAKWGSYKGYHSKIEEKS